jgi:hypothetical protein
MVAREITALSLVDHSSQFNRSFSFAGCGLAGRQAGSRNCELRW